MHGNHHLQSTLAGVNTAETVLSRRATVFAPSEYSIPSALEIYLYIHAIRAHHIHLPTIVADHRNLLLFDREIHAAVYNVVSVDRPDPPRSFSSGSVFQDVDGVVCGVSTARVRPY